MRDKTYQIKLKTGEVFKVGFKDEEDIKRWIATSAAGILTLHGNKKVIPGLIESITEILSCPKCGSENVGKTGLSLGVGSGPGAPPTTSYQYRCKDCGELFNGPRTNRQAVSKG